jgi:hemoglobin-like flavoprotein
MTIDLSDRASAIIAETLPLMEQHRASLEEAMERSMARYGPDHRPAGRAQATTGAIMDMLLDHARQPEGSRSAAEVAETARKHHALGLGGEHYSCFGDALKPIMKDVLRARATSPVLAAWTDAYWAIVRLLFRQETRLAA